MTCTAPNQTGGNPLYYKKKYPLYVFMRMRVEIVLLLLRYEADECKGAIAHLLNKKKLYLDAFDREAVRRHYVQIECFKKSFMIIDYAYLF